MQESQGVGWMRPPHGAFCSHDSLLSEKQWKGKTEPMGSAILPSHNPTSHHCFRFAWAHHPISTPRHPPSSFRLLSPPLFRSPKSPSLSKQLLSVTVPLGRSRARRCLNVWELEPQPATDGTSAPPARAECRGRNSVLELPG